MEGSLAPVACLEDADFAERGADCVTQEVWAKIQAAIDDVVDNITLADLVIRYQEKSEPMYVI